MKKKLFRKCFAASSIDEFPSSSTFNVVIKKDINELIVYRKKL